MTNKKFWLGMLAGLLTFGLVLAGCDNGSSGGGGGNTDPKKITITELTGKTGNVHVSVSSDSGNEVAMGEGTIASDAITVSLKKQDDSDCTGNGSYYLGLETTTDSKGFLYTNGQSLDALGVSSSADMGKLPKYNITSAVSTIPFGKFVEMLGS
ncbi:MAG: hypothetical protein LBG27_08305 [Spirochaetaceae bacterium]|nr:hypothetical protein [Spirochaetaceae bacterium]